MPIDSGRGFQIGFGFCPELPDCSTSLPTHHRCVSDSAAPVAGKTLRLPHRVGVHRPFGSGRHQVPEVVSGLPLGRVGTVRILLCQLLVKLQSFLIALAWVIQAVLDSIENPQVVQSYRQVRLVRARTLLRQLTENSGSRRRR
jgi:hypothetical protein